MSNISNYRDFGKLTRWVKYFLYLQIIMSVAALVSDNMEYRLYSDFENGVYTSQALAIADGEVNDRRQQIVNIIFLIVWVISAILILKWIYRANHSARQLGAESMKFTPGWAVGWYFIPIAALWKPYQAMREIWQVSRSPKQFLSAPVGGALPAWWTLWLVNGLVANVAFRLWMRAKDLDDYITASIWDQVSDFMGIPLAIGTFVLVNQIYKFQRTSAESIANSRNEEIATEAPPWGAS